MNKNRRIIWDLRHKHVFDELSDVQAGKLIKMVLNHCSGEEITMECPVLWMAYCSIADRIDWFNPQIEFLDREPNETNPILKEARFQEYLDGFLGDLNITYSEGE